MRLRKRRHEAVKDAGTGERRNDKKSQAVRVKTTYFLYKLRVIW